MRCLLIEDDEITSKYIRQALREAGHSVQTCDNSLDGSYLALNDRWDLIILDRLLPGGIDGLSIVEELRACGQNTPVLVLSALASVDERVRGLRAGGDDYLAKPFAFSELLARAEAIGRRNAPIQAARVLNVADLTLDLDRMRVVRGNTLIPLQPREIRLLEYFMRNEGRLVTRTMLLEAVWDCHFDPQTNVVNVQVSRLRSKIDKGFEPTLIHTIRGVGYRLGVGEQA
jgi:two-component system, OmpR family, response regulator